MTNLIPNRGLEALMIQNCMMTWKSTKLRTESQLGCIINLVRLMWALTRTLMREKSMKNSVNRRKRNSDQKILLKRERRPVSLSGRERLLTLRPLSLLKVQAVLTRTVVVWSFELHHLWLYEYYLTLFNLKDTKQMFELNSLNMSPLPKVTFDPATLHFRTETDNYLVFHGHNVVV